MQAEQVREKKVRSIADVAEKWGMVPVAAMEMALREFCYGPAKAMRLKADSDLMWEVYDIYLSRLVQQPPVYDHALMAAKLAAINIVTGSVR